MSRGSPLFTAKEVLVHLSFIRNKKQEYFVCLSLDSGQRLITRRVVTIGLLDMILAHPREVFAGPITDRAAAVIVAHNHPSGNATPSRRDIELTQQLMAAGQLLGLRVWDHVIVATNEHYSFRQHDLL
jgi:DNA repair protein RadC